METDAKHISKYLMQRLTLRNNSAHIIRGIIGREPKSYARTQHIVGYVGRATVNTIHLLQTMWSLAIRKAFYFPHISLATLDVGTGLPRIYRGTGYFLREVLRRYPAPSLVCIPAKFTVLVNPLFARFSPTI